MDAYMRAALANDHASLCRLGSLQHQAERLPLFSRWHLTTQEQLFTHLTRVWATDTPRVMLDLGCHAGHGSSVNISDGLICTLNR